MKDLLSEKMIVIGGITASGKSSLAVSISQFLFDHDIDNMIINADSIQMYDALKNLTAQPSDLTNHFLYSFLQPNALYSFYSWLEDVQKLIKEYPEKVPIIVGGSGLYLSALIDGINILPEKSSYVDDLELLTLEECKQMMMQIDSIALDILKDKRRLIRFIDLYKQTGKTFSQIMQEPKEKIINHPVYKIYKNTDDNKMRIMQRIEDNIELFIEEVSAQKEKIFNTKLETVIGFREIISFLNNNMRKDELIKQIYTKTCAYAKRQNTWFKKFFISNANIYK